MSIFTSNPTQRGFPRFEFTDRYDKKCHLQKSSIAFEECVWLGMNEQEPIIMARDAIRLGLKPIEGGEKDNGWVPYNLPEEVHTNTCMHLTQQQAYEIAVNLFHFAMYGELPTEPLP